MPRPYMDTYSVIQQGRTTVRPYMTWVCEEARRHPIKKQHQRRTVSVHV